MEEILELEKQIEETNKHIEKLKKQVEELKEIAKQDKKEHKSLSDYRCYEELKFDTKYKFIDTTNKVVTNYFDNYYERDVRQLNCGNAYSGDTPNELLEREIKKRQLWFELEKHLKENNCLATNEDWKNRERHKCTVHYDYDYKRVYFESRITKKTNTIYSTNENVLENYMNTLSEEDMKIMFDVEE